jgi:hypothetical protein
MDIEFRGQLILGNSPTRRGQLLRIGLAILVIALTIGYLVAITSDASDRVADIIRGGRRLIGLPILLYFIFRSYFSSYFTTAKLWKNPTTREPVAGRITSEGVVLTSSRSQRLLPWDSITRVRQNKEMIVLLSANGVFTALPRNFFMREGDWEQVRQLVEFRVMEAK